MSNWNVLKLILTITILILICLVLLLILVNGVIRTCKTHSKKQHGPSSSDELYVDYFVIDRAHLESLPKNIPAGVIVLIDKGITDEETGLYMKTATGRWDKFDVPEENQRYRIKHGESAKHVYTVPRSSSGGVEYKAHVTSTSKTTMQNSESVQTLQLDTSNCTIYVLPDRQQSGFLILTSKLLQAKNHQVFSLQVQNASSFVVVVQDENKEELAVVQAKSIQTFHFLPTGEQLVAK